MRSRTVVAALGDSITAGNPAYDPDAAASARLGFGHDPQSQWEYWAERKHPPLEIRNCGIFGERTDEIAQRLGECSEGAGSVVIQGGINDIAQGVPIDTAAANLRELVRTAKGMELKVALANVLPWNNGYPRTAPLIRELNAKIAKIAQSEGVPLLPFYETLDDSDSPGRMKREWTSDGDHPSIEGYRRLGELAFQPPSG